MAKNLANKSRKSGRWTCWRRCWTTRPCSRRRTTRTRPPCSRTVLSASPLASSWSGEFCSWGKPFNPGFELPAIRAINFDFWGEGQTWGLISAILKKTATGQGLACTMITRFSGFPLPNMAWVLLSFSSCFGTHLPHQLNFPRGIENTIRPCTCPQNLWFVLLLCRDQVLKHHDQPGTNVPQWSAGRQRWRSHPRAVLPSCSGAIHLVNCPSRSSLFLSLALCVDHHHSNRKTGTAMY